MADHVEVVAVVVASCVDDDHEKFLMFMLVA